VKASYYRAALDLIEAYSADATMNGLTLDQHAEERAVEMFTESIMRAGEHYLNQPMEVPFIPSWNRVRSALPSLLPRLHEAVEADNS
jgi:glucosyl-3-phosphoglycerate synthase